MDPKKHCCRSAAVVLLDIPRSLIHEASTRNCGTNQSTELNLTLSRLRHCGTSHSTQFTLSDANRAKPTFVHFGTAASVANVNAPLWTGIQQLLQLRKSSKQDM